MLVVRIIAAGIMGGVASWAAVAARAALTKIELLEGEVSHLRDVCRYLAERRGPR
jgi:hypothetical protein